jgi:hypothetical protein
MADSSGGTLMSVRSLTPRLLVAILAIAASACFQSETPTGPAAAPPSNSGPVHVIGLNTASAPLGLTRYNNGGYPVEVAPSGSVEMMRWNTRVQGTMFIVFEPIAAQPYFKALAQVEYNVLTVPLSPADEISATVRVARDSSGTVTAASEKPDVVEIVRVSPM